MYPELYHWLDLIVCQVCMKLSRVRSNPRHKGYKCEAC
jgi:hypothetical protein